jgi:hypothetical protein
MAHARRRLTAVVVLALAVAGAAQAQGDSYPRGDANCSITVNAADVVAQIGELAAREGCGNGDCDRDGQLTAADVDCTARCVFGRCPVPPHAPGITGVAPESAPGIVPFSLVRVGAERLQLPAGGAGIAEDDPAPIWVELGGQLAELAYEDEGELGVIVPDLPPGTADMVVRRGDLDGSSFPVEIASTAPIGAPDSLLDFLVSSAELIDTLLAGDLSDAWGENEDQARSALDEFRAELDLTLTEIEDAPDLPELESLLGPWIDGSGLPEMQRTTLGELVGAGGAAGLTSIAPVAKATVIRAGRGLAAAGRSAIAAASSAPAAGEAVSLGGGLVIKYGALAAGAGAIAVAAAGAVILTDETPLVFDWDLYPIAGMSFEVRGKGFGPIVRPDLVLDTSRLTRSVLVDHASASDTSVSYIIPNVVGLCGHGQFVLRKPLPARGGTSRSRNLVAIKPRLLGLSHDNVLPGDQLTVHFEGMAGCIGPARRREAHALIRETDGNFGRFPTDFLAAGQTKNTARLSVPRLVPARYEVLLKSPFVSLESRPLTIGTRLTDLAISCSTSEMRTSQPDVALCGVTGLPSSDDLPDLGAFAFVWTSSDDAVLDLSQPLGPKSRHVDVRPSKPGKASLSVALRRTLPSELIVASKTPLEITVVDDTRPTVALFSDSPRLVDPVARIDVLVVAGDEDSELDFLRLLAAGEAVEEDSRVQEYDCPEEKTCEHVFRIHVRPSGFSETRITVFAQAVDVADSAARTPNDLEFEVRLTPGSIAGAVRRTGDQSPVAGASVELRDGAGALIGSTGSAADGSFGFSGVPSGSYVLRVAAPGFFTREQQVTVTGGETAEVSLLLTAADGIGRMEFTVRKHSRTSEPGRAVAGAKVSILERQAGLIAEAFSDAQGIARIEALPAGEFVYQVDAPPLASYFGRQNITPNSDTVRRSTVGLYPGNQACASDLDHFMPTQTRSYLGDLIFLFNRTLDELFDLSPVASSRLIHPAASPICVRGDRRRPTIDWDVAAAEAAIGGPVTALQVTALGTASPLLFRLAAHGTLTPPIVYGAASGQGEDTGPYAGGAPPDLEPDAPYSVGFQAGGMSLTFRPR